MAWPHLPACQRGTAGLGAWPRSKHLHSSPSPAHRCSLHWHKNGDGEYACPTLGKVFTPHTHIVAIRPSGNVYCYEVRPGIAAGCCGAGGWRPGAPWPEGRTPKEEGAGC